MYRKSLLFGLVLGCIGAILTIELPHIMTLNPVIFVLLLPGVLASIAAAGHVHGYTTWVATLVNAFLWFAISAMLGVMFQWSLKVFGRGKPRVSIAEPESVSTKTSSQSKPGRSHSE
jgi:hypothetical protein